MIKTIYICDKCGKQKTIKKSYAEALDEGWIHEYSGQERKDYCSKKCKPHRKIKYVSTNKDSDPGVGSLYGRT